MEKKGHAVKRRCVSVALSSAMVISMLGVLPGSVTTAEAAPSSDEISNDTLTVSIGDLGQISSLTINDNLNSGGNEVNFVLPNDTSSQNNEAHQWMGEMIFSYRTSEDGTFPDDNSGFTEVDTNKTLAAGGSTTYSNATENLESNPYIEKTVNEDSVEIKFIGQELDSTDERTMKGFDVTSVYDTDTDDGSLLWTITLENTSDEYIEFGDVGLPMPWNNKYSTTSDTYNNRVTVHTFAGADSGYAYAIRCSGEGDYILFTPVVETGARIEYIDQWTGSVNGIVGTRSESTYQNWTSDSGGWYPGLSVYYIHSKDIQKTGRGYYTDATSLVLAPGESQSYSFRFSAVTADSEEDDTSSDVEERENNLRSILYNSGMIDAVAVPGFQTAINMTTQLDLHYDSSRITDLSVEIQCIHENDPYDEEHIPEQTEGLVNNSTDVEHSDTDSAEYVETNVVDGEEHHIYNLTFGCIGNNSVRVEYKLDGEEKFTQFEFNVLEELDEIVNTHSDFMVEETQDNDPDSLTYGIYSDWYLSSGIDTTQQTHWGDDWSHDNINFMTMKNYMLPEADEVESIEKYLIDFMWESYMANTQDTYTVANYLSASGIYSDTSSPYTRTYSQVMEATAFFNMYRIEKAYPDLIDYRESPEWYLEKAYGIYYNAVGSSAIGFYGEQQIPDMIEALRDEGMTEEADNLQNLFALRKGTNMATASYPYGSEFEYDNTGEEGAYSAAKALREYYPDSEYTEDALENMEKADWKTRAMRGIQPTWYQYADPVFRGGESWWNFQYTASLAGYIMDDWLRYEETDWDTSTTAWAERLSYAAKLSNFNAVNMGQISADSIGSVSWRYTMSKGGVGAQNVNDGGTRVMNNGWNDFSGESEEGLYGSLLSISADVATDEVFGLTGYGSEVSKSGTLYTIIPEDGFGKRINVIDDKVYVEMEQDSVISAVIDGNGTYFDLSVSNLTGTAHLSKIVISGEGVEDGYYSVKVDGNICGQCYVSGNEGTAYALVPEGSTAQITIEKMDGGENTAPAIYSLTVEEDPQALVPFRIETYAYDDGAPDGTLIYQWEVTEAPEGGTLTFDNTDRRYAEVTADLEGTYTVKLTVSDGELSVEREIEIVIGEGPEKSAPVIESATATQHPTNTTVAELSGSASGDSVYGNELEYEWSVVEQPEGGNAIIADADQTEAVMKAYVPGTYTIRLTVTDRQSTAYDEDISTYQDITLEMTGNVDGVERYGTVLTGVGEAPELPDTMTVIYPDATRRESAVEWDAVDEESYAEAGTFTVGGVVEGTDIKVEVTVMVVEGEAQNVALFAIPSAIIDTPEDLGGVAGLNDGYDPTSSRDTSHGVWHNWLGDNGSLAWVQYTWENPVTIYQSNAYYYTDGNFVPDEVWLEYLDENGEWREVTNAVGYGTALNQYNVTTFDPVTTTAIRMYMTPSTLGVGVIEWQIMGYADEVVDKTQLNRVINSANNLDLSLFSATEEQIAEFEAALETAQAVYDDSNATQEEIDLAAAILARIISNLPTTDGNLAYSATASTSFVSSWESLSAVNDGQIPEDSYDPDIPRYGTWGNTSSYETVTYTWSSEVTLSSADIYFWYDGDEGDYTSGGILVPSEYYYEYLDSDGNWQQVENASAYETEMDGFNNTTFDEVTTTSFRVTLMKQRNDYNGIGIMEWKVYGTSASAVIDKTALEAAIADAEVEDSSIYTEESWAAFEEALETARTILEEENASQAEVDAALALLVKAQNNLELMPEDKNIAPLATATGICDYVSDLGGLATLNDNIDPESSSDTSNGTWHNWNDRYDSDGEVQNAWIMYTWESPVILESTDVYYFSDGSGIQMPESVTFEYLDENGEWVTIDAESNCTADQYNTTDLGSIRTSALRLTMTPQYMSDGDPAHGVGVIEWKVYGYEVADKSALYEAIEDAQSRNEEDYTASSWKTLTTALEKALEVAENEAATVEEVESARKALVRAINALVGTDEEPLYDNIAPDATADGICDYVDDLGGLATLNDGYDPADSYDTSNGTWHNWHDRYVDGITQNAWVSYTWDQTVEISSMDIYYFADGSGFVEPESVSVEYLNEDGEWVAAEEAQELSCVLNEYNTIKLANITTTAIRLTLVPQYMNDSDPAHGVGIIEWKVYGRYADDEEEGTTANKDALNAAIEEALNRVEEDYTAETWDTFARALAKAQAVADNESATQETVDNATALLNEAMGALEPAGESGETQPPDETDKTVLGELIARGETFAQIDYTEESWSAFSDAFAQAQFVYVAENATQDEIDSAADALRAAIDSLEKAREDVELDTIREYIAQAQKLDENDYTAESWAVLQSALADALNIANDQDATQEDIDARAEALKDAIDSLVKVSAESGEEAESGEGQQDGGQSSTSENDLDGSTSGTSEESQTGDSVQTGDNTPVALFAATAVVALAVAGGAWHIYRRRRKNR